MRIETQEIRVFKTIVEENGFNRASKKLHISQSAVSQALANFENKLDAQLLTRNPLSLTEAGKRMLTYANDVLREEESVIEDLSKIKSGLESTLSVAMNSSINRFYGGELVLQFCDENPLARLKVEEKPSREIIYAVMSGKSELGMGPFQSQMHGFKTQELYSETRRLVVSKKHPQFDQLQADPETVLKQLPLLSSYLDEPDLRPSIHRIRDSFSTVWEISSITLRLQLVAAGKGVTFVGEKLLANEEVCKDFVHLSMLPFGNIYRQVGLYHRKNTVLSEGAKRFIQICNDFWQLENHQS